MLEDLRVGSPALDESSRFDYRKFPLDITSSPTSSISDSGCSVDSDSQQSVASSQTSYSSQSDSWLSSVQPDLSEPLGKQLSVAQGRLIVPQPSTNTRRTGSRDAAPPLLQRQQEKKGQFVYHLVDSAAQLVEVIWPTAAPACVSGAPQSHQSMLPLRVFIEETLRRSKTSFSTLQVALYYLILLKPHVPSFDFTMEQPEDAAVARALQCGRRMFLAALILASKYLQDRNYSAKAWSKISGLQVTEINLNERAFLAAVKWKLHVPDSLFNKWQDFLVRYSHPSKVSSWRMVVRVLQPDLTYSTAFAPTFAFNPESSFKIPDWKSSHSPSSSTDSINWSSSASSPVAASPQILESSFTMQAPVAPMPHKLPTPSPLTSIFQTPAAGLANDMLRQTMRPRGAMCSAMSMASNVATARYCNDLPPSAMGLNGAPGYYSRSMAPPGQPPLTTDAMSSVASSPRSGSPCSMISDHTSRSSSISSTFSLPSSTSPSRNQQQSRLAFVAAFNAANRKPAVLDDSVTIVDSTPLTISDKFHLTASPDVIDVVEDDATPIAYSSHFNYQSNMESRKRHRCSVDSAVGLVLEDSNEVVDVQDHVRRLLRPELLKAGNGKPAAKKPCFMTQNGRIDYRHTVEWR